MKLSASSSVNNPKASQFILLFDLLCCAGSGFNFNNGHIAPTAAAVIKIAICVPSRGKSIKANVLSTANSFRAALVQKLFAILNVASATITTANSFNPAIMAK